jgi:1-acyl-sn-glycerol-3-phosphate acyltransferase
VSKVATPFIDAVDNHGATRLRSAVFFTAFYVWGTAMHLIAMFGLVLPMRFAVVCTEIWVQGTLWLLRAVVGIDMEVRGRARLPDQPVIFAAKHQSIWDTLVFVVLLRHPAMVMKKELLWIPIYGWLSRRLEMIAVDRSAGSEAMRSLIRGARAAVAAGRSPVIFPQGTRVHPNGAKRPYQSGIAALYRQLERPVVPVAVNSGLFWARGSFHLRPGTIVLDFLTPIEVGLDRRTFMRRLEDRIETASERLVAEARDIYGASFEMDPGSPLRCGRDDGRM